MSDIFISYASADRGRVIPLVKVLQGQGWSVFWDRKIPTGKTWDQFIAGALNDARCVIVLWSRHSVQSKWVQIEAHQADRRTILVPAMLDAVEIPLAFSLIQAANLVDWAGTLPHAEVEELVQAVSEVLSRTAAPASEAIATTTTGPAAETRPAPDRRDVEDGEGAETERPAPIASADDGHAWSMPRKRLMIFGLPAAALIGAGIYWQSFRPPVNVPAVTAPVTAVNPASPEAGPVPPPKQRETPPAGSAKPESPRARVVAERAKPIPGAERKALEVRTNPDDGQNYVWIPPGEFEIGCSPGDRECFDNEKPPRTVAITRGFWLGQTEVTVAAYRRNPAATMPAEPIIGETKLNPQWSDQEQPVVRVAWAEAKSYCETWAKGRLPTEAEWEYAARAGSRGARHGDLLDNAWYAGNSGSSILNVQRAWEQDAGMDWAKYLGILERNGNQIHKVATRQPNSWVLYDMLGNVWEWVADWYDGNYYKSLPSHVADPKGPAAGALHVVRGGSWSNNSGSARASNRNGVVEPDFNLGFRCAREVIP